MKYSAIHSPLCSPGDLYFFYRMWILARISNQLKHVVVHVNMVLFPYCTNMMYVVVFDSWIMFQFNEFLFYRTLLEHELCNEIYVFFVVRIFYGYLYCMVVNCSKFILISIIFLSCEFISWGLKISWFRGRKKNGYFSPTSILLVTITFYD